MKHTNVQLLSKVTNKQTQYVRLDELPSKFRSYPKGINIFTRRLTMEETFNMSSLKLDMETGFKDLARVYEDVIITDNPNVTLYDLELVDFQLAVAVSSVWSSTDFGFKIRKQCPNPMCGEIITQNVTIDDFNFTDAAVNVPVPLIIDGVEFNMRPLRVKDIIAIGNDMQDKEANYKRGILEYCYMLDCTVEDRFKDIRELYDFIKAISDIEYNKLRQIDQDITVVNYPLEVTCHACKETIKINKQLTTLKAYL